MALIDIAAIFSPFTANGGTPDSLAISTATASSKTYDVTGAGLGNAPPQVWGTGTSFTSDMGVGDGPWTPFAKIVIGTSLAGGTSMNFSLQSAPDNGSNGAGSWTTVDETGAIAVANLAANTTINLHFARRQPGASVPRFYRILYTPVGTFNAGTVSAGIVVNDDNATDIGQVQSNISFGTAG